MAGQGLGLGVAGGHLSLDLHLGVGQPARHLLHEQQVKHVALESVGRRETDKHVAI